MPEGAAAAVSSAAAHSDQPPDRSTALAWTIILEPHGRSGAENMAVDCALLDAVAGRPHRRAYLRLYRWRPSCLSFGRHEPAAARYDRARLEREGIDVVRRPTGGRAVWHADEITYAVVAPVTAFGSLTESYWRIHRRIAAGLRALGVDARLAAVRGPPGPLDAGSCFARPVGGEILVDGKKLVGSAQVRDHAALLQHGSLLLEGSQALVARMSRGGVTPPSYMTLSQALGRAVGFSEGAWAIVQAWRAAGETITFESPTAAPSSHVAHFADPEWTWRR